MTTTATKAPAKKPRRANGEGSYKLRKDGLYEASIELPRDPASGKRRRAYVTGKAKVEVTRKLNALKSKMQRDGNIRTDNPTVNEWIDFWFANYCKVRPKTRASYIGKARYVRDVIGKKKLASLEPADLRRVYQSIEAKGLSPSTASNTHRVFAKMCADAIREGVVETNVTKRIDAPRRAVHESLSLTPDQARDVIRHVAGMRNGSRWVAALLTGARQGELLGLTWDRVDFESNTIELSWQLQRLTWLHGCEKLEDGPSCGKRLGSDCPDRTIPKPDDWEHRYLYDAFWLTRPKTRAGWRVVPLVDPLRAILLRHKENTRDDPNPDGFVWTADPKQLPGGYAYLPLDGKCIDPSRDNRAWHNLLYEVGIEKRDSGGKIVGRSIRLHDARHTAVTLLFDLGIPEALIQAIVGQSTIAVTRGYRAKSTASLVEAMSKLGAALDPAQPATLTMYRTEPKGLTA